MYMVLLSCMSLSYGMHFGDKLIELAPHLSLASTLLSTAVLVIATIGKQMLCSPSEAGSLLDVLAL